MCFLCVLYVLFMGVVCVPICVPPMVLYVFYLPVYVPPLPRPPRTPKPAPKTLKPTPIRTLTHTLSQPFAMWWPGRLPRLPVLAKGIR